MKHQTFAALREPPAKAEREPRTWPNLPMGTYFIWVVDEAEFRRGHLGSRIMRRAGIGYVCSGPSRHAGSAVYTNFSATPVLVLGTDQKFWIAED